MSGFGQNLLEGNTGIQCDAAGVFVLWRETFGARFDSNDSPWRDYFHRLARLHAAFGEVETHAQSGGFGEQQGNEWLAVFRGAEDLQHDARAILLHLGGDDDDIEAEAEDVADGCANPDSASGPFVPEFVDAGPASAGCFSSVFSCVMGSVPDRSGILAVGSS